MFSLPNFSLINAKIAQFYKCNIAEDIDNVSVYYHDNGAINLQKLVEYLWPNQEPKDIFKVVETYQYEDYLIICNKLLPIFQCTKQILNNLGEYSENFLKIRWMGKNVNHYLDVRSSYHNNNTTETMEHVLILTSILANALTNVYLTQTQGKHAPHLLKDLINSKEIIDIFGLEMVLILKILMGSPNSINLRNIVWHGFPKPTELPNYYVKVLLILIHSLGCVIEAKNLIIKERFQITTFNEHIKIIRENYKLKPLNLENLQQQVELLNNDFKPYWLQLISHYKSQKYKEFIILVLPQIELLLRLHYGQVNNFDVSAKLDEYYITMDTIFETQVINADEKNISDNKLLDFENSLFEGCFHMLFDIFISPNGCRLRDKVSHGEVSLEALDNSELCSIILYIFISLLFPLDYRLFDNYESNLHLNCLTKVKLTNCIKQIHIFYEKHLLTQDLPLISLASEYHKVLIFKRPKKENELVLLVNKIAKNIFKTILNYEESIAVRRNLLAQHELHSKRRKTLEKLQTALPDIFKTLMLILSSICKIYCLLQNNFTVILKEEFTWDKTLRFLKHSLTISENFVKYSHCESNEWIKSLELCRKYDDFHKKLFLYEE
ncbi:endoplasmic reticulum membrane-associated RNA degradation protein-like [Lucilia sericata]|uniref:endoplasmic reticulum membrane-associated RNA degradation protein-like n=1 Tax=Lucilia sericata TaxID=13632 RepID=UPI0018A873C6|nr:endoplasmic reticulum membrane-associated RNA degradation protein-like [Lucilia sericata]